MASKAGKTRSLILALGDGKVLALACGTSRA